MSELTTINNYLHEAAALLKAKKAHTKEFQILVKKINNESLLLSPVERSLVLERFFAIWDRKN